MVLLNSKCQQGKSLEDADIIHDDWLTAVVSTDCRLTAGTYLDSTWCPKYIDNSQHPETSSFRTIYSANKMKIR